LGHAYALMVPCVIRLINSSAMAIDDVEICSMAVICPSRLARWTTAESCLADGRPTGTSVHVLFVGQPDSMTPLGTKGVGELAMSGMAAAIANAVYHAVGRRVRSLPISIEKVLGRESSSLRTSL
jgi:hypothetical protein